MADFEIHTVLCLTDNYAVLLHDAEAGVTAVVDTPEVAPIEAALAEKGWRLTHILNTHWHPDHTGGNLELQEKTGAHIIGPRNEQEKIPGIQTAVGQGDSFDLGGHEVRVLDVPGHTAGAVNYFFPDDKLVFTGDTLFAMGCGRLFEGTPETMWGSLQKLMALPKDTRVYFGHEYTESNATFALSVDPDNPDLRARAQQVEETRAAGQATIPSTIDLELRTNPFLRAEDPGLQKTVDLVGANPIAVFAETRLRKDNS